MNTFKVRDLRRKGYFTIDNEFLDKYAGFLGSIASMIYISLCRHADKNQESFPSQETIAYEIKTTRETVNRKLQLLERHNLISFTKTKDEETGKWMNNVYTLVDKSEWSPTMLSQITRSNVTPDDMGSHEVHVTSDNTKKIEIETNNIKISSNNVKKNYQVPKEVKQARRERRQPFNYQGSSPRGNSGNTYTPRKEKGVVHAEHLL